jgi:hypothetical protein
MRNRLTRCAARMHANQLDPMSTTCPPSASSALAFQRDRDPAGVLLHNVGRGDDLRAQKPAADSEVQPHDAPGVEDPVVVARQIQFVRLRTIQVSNILAGVGIETGAAQLKTKVGRQRLRHYTDPLEPLAGLGRGANLA